MRMSATKLVGVIAVGGALLASSACGPLDSVTGGGDKKAACDNIKSAAEKLSSTSVAPDPNNPQASVAASTQKLTDFASTVRSEGQKAGGDVESSASKFASDIDAAAASLRQMASNPLGGTSGLSSINNMKTSGEALSKACGFSGGFRIGM
ncbi:hypothetical protein J4573_19420 [Actinomadura barringtoniae]|uniref:Small secreted protein n=2 Tax=Actinomadura barringtoniae TaxID=1427535 RepID=A0A939PFR7_9ACTN|nr:hypothetical protein [Actinomadura barringtoniae]